MGYLAVDFFFRLSGFVIADAYEPKLRSGEKSDAPIGYSGRVDSASPIARGNLHLLSFRGGG